MSLLVLYRFLVDAINPEQAVVFLNTDRLPLRETKQGTHVQNDGEARLVGRLVDLFIKGGLDYRDIGVISPYRQQLKIIRESIKAHSSLEHASKVEVDTVDRYQVSSCFLCASANLKGTDS